LREGWDNPNVFVITKLRSSGSEISKLQEVGRGLRLPFDENGTRVGAQNSNEDFRLTYIIDYSEREFAKKLVGEINFESGGLIDKKITDDILSLLTKSGYADNNAKAKGRLLFEGIIDEHDVIVDIEKLFAALPEDGGIKIKDGRITGEGMSERPKVHLNRANFAKLKNLWNEVSRRYVLHFEKVDEADLKRAIKEIFAADNIFAEPSVQIVHERLDNSSINIETSYSSAKTSIGVMNYGEFLKILNKRTSLPLPLLHEAIISARHGKNTPHKLFNNATLDNVIKAFEKVFLEMFGQRFSYYPLDYKARTSIFTVDGDFVSELEQGVVGSIKANDIVFDKKRYLYDEVVYDSEIEHEILKISPPKEVVVYGKLPRSSIKVPTYTGGTTSPDFVYAISYQDTEDIELHLIIETKSENPRLSDIVAVEAQKKAFEKIGSGIKWRMETNAASFQKELEKFVKG
jgi:type III restriction enzyme